VLKKGISFKKKGKRWPEEKALQAGGEKIQGSLFLRRSTLTGKGKTWDKPRKTGSTNKGCRGRRRDVSKGDNNAYTCGGCTRP